MMDLILFEIFQGSIWKVSEEELTVFLVFYNPSLR